MDWTIWDIISTLMYIVYIPACIGLIVIVLLQKGKDSGFAGAFGVGGGGDTVFGPRAGKTLPQRLTVVAAVIFMVCAVLISMVASRVGKGVAPEMAAELTNAEAAEELKELEARGLGSATPNATLEVTGTESETGVDATETTEAVTEAEAPAAEPAAVEEPAADVTEATESTEAPTPSAS
jgi:preprotein translocase subunit SecG